MKLEYDQIRVRLSGREILKGVSLIAESGRMTGIIGPNGCGKSTLVKTTFGICIPNTGQVLADGSDLSQYSPRERATLIGYVGQDTGCPFDFSVSDVVGMAMYARSDRSLSAKEVIRQALEELQISHLRNRSILSLSGGERKLAFIARAVAQGADALILDEPTNHLDIRHQLFLLDYLKSSGKTVLIVLHDLRLAAHYCDHLVLLENGLVAASGKPLEVLSAERVKQVFGICGKAYAADGQVDFSLFR